jgi:hypothetical protein
MAFTNGIKKAVSTPVPAVLSEPATPAPQAAAPDQSALLAAMQAQIAALQAQLAAKAKPRGHSVKATEKGGVSVYGLGRFPVTLYCAQWEALLGQDPSTELGQLVMGYIKANKGKPVTVDVKTQDASGRYVKIGEKTIILGERKE